MNLPCLEPFNHDFRQAIVSVLEAPRGRPPLACFDADGTLWSEDIGEAFFRWLIAGHLLPTIDCTKDVYAEYEERVAANRADGYSWAVQAMDGISETSIDLWSRQFAAAWPNYRPEMVALAHGMAVAGVEVWLVSATNRWTVAAAARRMKLDPTRVIAMSVEVQDGRLTNRPELPLICNAGKVEAIDNIIGRRPDLVFGDSMGDFEMMEAAVQPLVVGRNDRPANALVTLAGQRGWPVHRF